jgi:hypothetical protein
MLGRVTQANRTCESLGRDGDILWKTFPLSSKHVYYRSLTGKNPEKYRLSRLFTVKHYAGMAGLRTWPTQNQDRDRQQQIIGTKIGETPRKNERPVRGDNRTGQAIWALGWMGACAEYSLVGEGLPLPQ